jgi:hypothetical protein
MGTRAHQYNTYYYPEAMAELETEQEDPVSYQTFCELWRVLYPHSVNRPFNSLPGHCHTCAHLEDLKAKLTDNTSLASLAKAHLMHRGGHYMLERDSYMRRRRLALAVENRLKPKILSLIIGNY